MQENVKMAFEFAKDFHQLLISLSTGVIAVSVLSQMLEVLNRQKGSAGCCDILIFQVLLIAFGVWSPHGPDGISQPSTMIRGKGSAATYSFPPTFK